MNHSPSPRTRPFIIIVASLMLCVCNLHAQVFRDVIILLDSEQLETAETHPLTRLFKAAVQEGAAPIMASPNLVENAKIAFANGSIVATSNLMVIVIPPKYLERLHKEAQDLKLPETIRDSALCGFNFEKISMQNSLSAEEKAVKFISKRLSPTIADHECIWNIYLIGHGKNAHEVTANEKTTQPSDEKKQPSAEHQETTVIEEKDEKKAALPKMPTAEKIIQFCSKKTQKAGSLIAGLKPTNFTNLLKFFNGKDIARLCQERRELIKKLALLKTIDSQCTTVTSAEEKDEKDVKEALTNDDVVALKKIVAQTWQTMVTNKLAALAQTPTIAKAYKKRQLAVDFKTQLDGVIAQNEEDLERLQKQQALTPSVTTGVFCYTGCLVGGYHRYIVEQALRNLSFQSYVLAVGMDNLTTISFKVIQNPTFNEFFTLAKTLVTQQKLSSTDEEIKSSDTINNLFSGIAGAVGGNEWYNNLHSFWYVPGRDTFETYTTEQNVFVLGNVMAKKHEREKTAINATNYPIVLVQPIRIMQTLKIDWGTSIIPLQSHEAEDIHTLRFFNALSISPSSASTVLPNNFFAHLLKFQGVYAGVFCIKTLECPIPVLTSFPEANWPADAKDALAIAQKNPTANHFNKRIVLENVIIIARLPGKIHIACSYAHKTYHALIEISEDEMKKQAVTVRRTYIALQTIAERINFEPSDYDLTKEFTHLYQFIQRKDLARSGTVTDDDVQQDNKKYETPWAVE